MEIQFRSLTEVSELEKFRQQFKVQSGTDLDLKYLQGSEVFGGFDGLGQMIAGYLLAPAAIMRWPKFLPERPVLLEQVGAIELIELNGVWIDPTLRRKTVSIAFWSHVAGHLSRRPESYITYGVDMRKKGLNRLYSLVISGTVYTGPLKGSSAAAGSVYWSHPRRFLLFRVVYLYEWFKRVGRDRAIADNSNEVNTMPVGIAPHMRPIGLGAFSFIIAFTVLIQIAIALGMLPFDENLMNTSSSDFTGKHSMVQIFYTLITAVGTGLFGGWITGRMSSLVFGVVHAGIAWLVAAGALVLFECVTTGMAWRSFAPSLLLVLFFCTVGSWLAALVGGSFGSQKSLVMQVAKQPLRNRDLTVHEENYEQRRQHQIKKAS